MKMRSWLPSHRYTSIGHENDEDDDNMLSRRLSAWKHGRIHFFYIVLIILVAVITTHYSSSPPQQSLYYWEEPVRSEIQLRNTPKIFNMDTDYAIPPSETINEAWSSLIPKRGGFFTDRAISPRESCFALHPDTKNSTSHHTEHGSHKGHSAAADANASNNIYHVGHCFDLLRQAIMCRPDLTAEPFDPIVGGVTGFGTEHQCINWRDLMDWMVANE
ncbi:hypothetical protein LX32DRAFT_702769 [Colletotrichum zoysiae]|uniref:Oxidase ustYa n=1 Tax=Colletotrichum zoysiae TaxID=1216348 RepID=A0AAD9HBL2_9PEZI|nr:hypothetical protein LX32DRAFT_702769 [Colletotrichum zoysiae]